jgi:hypothetical protein
MVLGSEEMLERDYDSTGEEGTDQIL